MTDLRGTTTAEAPREPPALQVPDAGRDAQPTGRPEVIHAIQTLVTALILAFVFRCFMIEAFVIPTGSMAETVLGRHGTALCPRCGWEYDYGPALTADGRPGKFLAPDSTLCPNCHLRRALRPERSPIKRGDRILVHKWPYVLGGPFKPRRWDVIVFRDPLNPSQNFIKRLVALPGETVEIIDGDVYITDPATRKKRIARKPPAAQKALWSLVYDQNHLPLDLDAPPRWVADQPDESPARGWYGLRTRVFHYAGLDATPRSISFNPGASGLYLQDVYGYNHGAGGSQVSDLRVIAEVTQTAGNGWMRWELTCGTRRFAALIQSDGTARLSVQSANAGGSASVIGTAQLPPLRPGRTRIVEFGHVDYRVYLKVDGKEALATSDEQYAPALETPRNLPGPRSVGLRLWACSASFELRGLRIDRDVHYTHRPGYTRRAAVGDPFTLGPDEYFVLGDNSPHSHDSREWYRVGRLLEPAWQRGEYRLGTVRADQIVGRAFFVYLPGFLPLDTRGRWRIPDLGRVRFVR